jgi:hypothetical protein
MAQMMNMESRHGKMVPIIKKALVELDGPAFKEFEITAPLGRRKPNTPSPRLHSILRPNRSLRPSDHHAGTQKRIPSKIIHQIPNEKPVDC